MEMMSHPVSSEPDENLTIECPHINHFNRLESPRWLKGFRTGVPLTNRTRYEILTEDKVSLTIRNVSAEDEGLYTCWLTVMFNNVKYNVSRTWKLRVLSPVTRVPVTKAEAATKSGDVTLTCSSLVIKCKAMVDQRSPDIAELTWLVDGQLLDRSYLHGRAFQEIRVSSDHVEALLVFPEVREEDTKARLSCVAQNGSGKQEVVIRITLEDSMWTWLVVALVGSSFFMLVVCVLLHLLCRQQRKHNYLLARQNSTF
ncbi:Interleukin-1 receptor type 2 [Bagarius yarrelli]|uniref:Interleukin-1 receptor type 2 n=1 Tax=Bagarius yarrelli TaxID=175774 RepID=A0A556VW56_BAGYA|nr:Interleukin-1 receptor type 2 [Bagarius yarrelli]